MSNVPGSGADSQYEEISTHPQTGDRVPGIPGKLRLLVNSVSLHLAFPSEKMREDSKRGSNPHTAAAGVNMGPGQVCWESLRLSNSHLASH